MGAEEPEAVLAVVKATSVPFLLHRYCGLPQPRYRRVGG